ncbi:MAG: enoyl-CoA hydratase-related protein [Candidatus Tectomicrobia bacterium]|nr:enoyl-CoA hydratase-related protein [Candidatus Tectomicrobia bacterium]
MSELLESLEDGVLTLTINRPHAHNTLSTSLSHSLSDALVRAEDNADVRCIVLTGAGGIFCAGGDVNDQASGNIAGDETDPEAAQVAMVKTIRDGMEMSRLLREIPKPTLAVISGAAAGAGLALALACDLRFCLDTAKLTTAFAKLGLSGDSGGAYFLPQLVGTAKARELYFMADVISGREAYEIGLVSRVASAETFEEESQAFARHLAGLPTVALGYMKMNLNAAEHMPLSDVFDLEAENIVRCMKTEDHKQAAQAFLKKEPPVFKGR